MKAKTILEEARNSGLRLEFEVPDGELCTGCSNCNKDDGICLLFNQYFTRIF